MECFLDAHVPSSQTNRHDSPHPVLGPSSAHTTVSAPLTSPAGHKHESPPLLRVAGVPGVKGPSTVPVLLLLRGLLSQYSACMLHMCSNREVQ